MARYRAGDHAGAAVLFRQAADAGNSTATYEMGYLDENGDGVRKDEAQSAQWYTRGARMGNAASEAAVGQLYEYGNQVQENWDTAAQWYTKSAEQGYVMGEFRLGRAYQYGVGIAININAAEQWYERAAAQGDSQSAFFAKYIRDNPGIDTTWYSAQEKKATMDPTRCSPGCWNGPPPDGAHLPQCQSAAGLLRGMGAQCRSLHSLRVSARERPGRHSLPVPGSRAAAIGHRARWHLRMRGDAAHKSPFSTRICCYSRDFEF